MSGTSKQEVTVGDLQFREITPDMNAATRLLINKEGVHPIPGENDVNAKIVHLANHRMAKRGRDGKPDPIYNKRCFGLFAPGSDVPECTVFVNLMRLPADRQGHVRNDRLPGNIGEILDAPVQKIESPNTAIFYSITNAAFLPDGSLDKNHPTRVKRDGENSPTTGERLIGEVAKKLREHGITNFSTLSPLRSKTGKAATGFKQWLKDALERETPPITSSEIAWLRQTAQQFGLGSYSTTFDCVMKLRQQYQHGQFSDPRWERTFKTLMEELGLYYLAEEKAKGHGPGKHIPRDGVAKFHLSNGGEIANIHFNPRSKTTPSDEEGSLGLMVNYRYDLDKLEERKKAYERGYVVMDPELAARYEKRMQTLGGIQNGWIYHPRQKRDNWLAQIIDPGDHSRAARGR